MTSYRARPTRPDRAKAIAAVALVHLGLAALVLSGHRTLPDAAERARTILIDISPAPPPPPPEPQPGRAREEAGKAGKKADPTPVVAPRPKIELPATSPVPAAPVAGTGSRSSAGAAISGNGTGAGGAGTGRGGGGSGGGIGAPARLLSGGLTRRDYRALRSAGPASGRAVLAISVGPNGRVEQCAIADSSGDPGLDAALCSILEPRMRWAAARDLRGQPITVRVHYVATWDR